MIKTNNSMLFARKTKEKIQSLEEHLKGTLNLLIKILSLNNIDIEPSYVKLLALLHDCGKADKRWQRNYPNINKLPHSLLSLPLVHAIAKKLNSDEVKRILLGLIIVSHHRTLHQDLYSEIKVEKVEYDKEIFEFLRKQGIEITEEEIEKLLKEKIYDWESKSYIERLLEPNNLLNLKYIGDLLYAGLEKDENFIDQFWKLQGALIEADFIDVAKWKENKSLEDFFFPFNHFFCDKQPTGDFLWQLECINSTSNFIIIRMPTGTGKTEASLFWAKNHNPKRLFYVLPVTFAINSVFERFKKYFGEERVGIYHHWADIFLHERYAEDLDNFIYFKHMLFPVEVITPDQIVLSFLHWRRWTVKLFSFFNSTFIFDEIHTYDLLLFSHLRIILRTLRNKFNARIALITATFPTKLIEIEEFKNFVFLPSSWENHYKKRCVGNITYQTETLEEWLEKNIDKIEKEWKDKRILIVVNTVERSQKIFRLLKNKCKRKVQLIHARFTLADRIMKEKDVVENQPEILVATQIVEVSLDIDYDILFTEIAPLDALIQRMGRVNRHRKRVSQVIIFEVPSSEPYEKELIEEARRRIKNLEGRKNDFELYEEFNKYFNVFFNLFIERYKEAEEIWNRFSSDIWSFQCDEKRLEKLLRDVKIINIPAIPECFLEKIYKLKEEARKLWEATRKSLDEKEKNEAIKKEIEIRKHIVEIPIYYIPKYCYYNKGLGHWIVELSYSPEEGLQMHEENL